MISSERQFWTFHAAYWLFAAVALFLYGLSYGHAQVAFVRNIYNPLIGFVFSYLIRAIYDHRLPAGLLGRLLLIIVLSTLGGVVSSIVVNPLTFALLGYDLQTLPMQTMFQDGLYFVLFYVVWSLLYLQFMGKPLASATGAPAALVPISVTKHNKIFRLDPLNLTHIKASGDYVELFTEQDSYLKQGTISYYEQALNSGPFVRIHRSIIVNTQKISSVSGPSKGQYLISLADGREVRSSRNYAAVVENLTPQAP